MNKLWALPVLSLAFTSAHQILASTPVIATTLFRTPLNVEQEVCSTPEEPCPTESDANGFAEFLLNDDEDELSYKFEINGLDLGFLTDNPQTPDEGDDVFKAHIHFGPPGVAGPVVFAPIDLTMDMTTEDPDQLHINPFEDSIGGTVTGVWKQEYGAVGATETTLKEQLENLKAGNLYANVHSRRFLVNGELRGQIEEAPQEFRKTEEVPEPFSIMGLALASSMGLLLRRRKQA